MTRFSRYSGTATCVRIDADVTSIPDEAFFECGNILEVILPDGLQEIGEKAFCCCASLSKLLYPKVFVPLGLVHSAVAIN
jgi:hypothetical protein